MQFVADNEDYFKSTVFGKILAFVQQHAKTSRMKDTAGKFTLTIENITAVDGAVKLLEPLAAG